MIVHVLDLFRPRKERELIAARRAFWKAHHEANAASDRGDTRRMCVADAALRQANLRLLSAERAAGWPR